MKHGGSTAYRKGCRCPECRAANAARVRRNRERRRLDPSRLTHGLRSAWDAGCRCLACSDVRKIVYMLAEGGYKPHWWHRTVTDTYDNARDAWEALRESGTLVWAVAGAASGVACYQLSEDEFRSIYPAPTFKSTLIGMRTNR